MAGFPLGSFAGGLAQGLDQGSLIRLRQQQIVEQERQRQAQALVGQWLQSPDANPVGPPAANGNASPAQGGPPASVPMPGASPMPPGMGGPPAAAAGPAAAGPAPAAPSGPATGAPGPAASPGASAPASGGGAPMSGTAQPVTPPSSTAGTVPDDPNAFMQSLNQAMPNAQKTLKALGYSIAQANPGKKWKPEELYDATELALKQMNGLDPMERIAAQGQIAASRAQWEYYSSEVRKTIADQSDDTKRRGQDLAAKEKQDALDAAWKRATLTSDTRLKTQAMADATRMQAEQLIQSGANDRSDKLLQFKQQALDAGLDEKTWATNLSAQLKEQGLSDAFVTKLFSAESSNAEPGKAPAPPARPQVGRSAPPKIGGGKGKPIPPSTLAQWKQVPAANKVAAKQHLIDQGFDVSTLQ